MHYYFLPFNLHVDLGFGATADSYKDSAEIILKSFENSKSTLEQLPLCFLFRHSIELYLKSMIIVLHHGLTVPYEENSSKEDPRILINGKAKRLFTEHSIVNLFEYFHRMVLEKSAMLSEIARTDWTEIPEDLVNAIRRIEQFDAKSSYFRYPVSQGRKIDNEKSAFKEVQFDEIVSIAKKINEKATMTYMQMDENEVPVQTFLYDNHQELEILEDLKLAAKTLSGAHLGLRVELAEGY